MAIMMMGPTSCVSHVITAVRNVSTTHNAHSATLPCSDYIMTQLIYATVRKAILTMESVRGVSHAMFPVSRAPMPQPVLVAT